MEIIKLHPLLSPFRLEVVQRPHILQWGRWEYINSDRWKNVELREKSNF